MICCVGQVNRFITESGVGLLHKLRHKKVVGHTAVTWNIIWIALFSGIQIGEIIAGKIRVKMKIIDVGTEFFPYRTDP